MKCFKRILLRIEKRILSLKSRKTKCIVKRSDEMEKVLFDEENKKRFAEDAWLNYFNRYLFENGAISEKEYIKMTERIANRKAKLSQNKRSCFL